MTGLRQIAIARAADGAPEMDWVAVEAPLEIRLDGTPLVVTLRTPGHDLELAAGFLFTEGIVTEKADLLRLEPCRDALAYDPDNVVEVELAPEARQRRGESEQARREFMAVAACGLCGKARLEDIYRRWPKVTTSTADLELLRSLPERLVEHQRLFNLCGGVHAAALFDFEGHFLELFEDVGRHNAVDKLIGSALLAGRVPLEHAILVSTARAGFEIVQKAIMAQIPIVVAVGAASSLAVDAAARAGVALYSFVSAGSANRHLGEDLSAFSAYTPRP